jgi:hypothetical protein
MSSMLEANFESWFSQHIGQNMPSLTPDFVALDQQHNGKLSPALATVLYWSNQHAITFLGGMHRKPVPLPTPYLEAVMTILYKEAPASQESLLQVVANLFHALSMRLANPVLDFLLNIPRNNPYNMLMHESKALGTEAARMYDLAVQAIKADGEGNHETAIALWGQIFPRFS